MQPKFIEPNRHVMQIHSEGRWTDYGSIKNELDMKLAIANVKNGEGRLRIVEKHMGTKIVYGPFPNYE